MDGVSTIPSNFVIPQPRARLKGKLSNSIVTYLRKRVKLIIKKNYMYFCNVKPQGIDFSISFCQLKVKYKKLNFLHKVGEFFCLVAYKLVDFGV